MVSLMSLWLPILVSAVVAFVLSFLIHMVFTYHRSDFPKVPNEDGVMDALRKLNIPPGDYMMPRCETTKEMKQPEFIEKMKKGPVMMMTVMPNGEMSMGRSLVQWFIYCVVVSVFAAYIAGQALAPGAPYLKVFQFAGCTAFIAYTMAYWQTSIWYRRKWSTTLKVTLDGLIFALFTGGVFGSMWPHA